MASRNTVICVSTKDEGGAYQITNTSDQGFPQSEASISFSNSNYQDHTAKRIDTSTITRSALDCGNKKPFTLLNHI